MTARVSFAFNEGSAYGQDVLELLGMVSELMQEDKVYGKTEVKDRLNEIRKKSKSIINKFTYDYWDDREYVGLDKEVE